MDRDRIMNACAYTPAFEVLPQSVAMLGTDHVEMPHGFNSARFSGSYNVRALKEIVIELGVVSAGGIPLFQIFQFHSENRCLQRVEPAVVTSEEVVILLFLAVITQHLQAFCDLAVIGDNHAAVPIGAQVFPGIEAEGLGIPQ